MDEQILALARSAGFRASIIPTEQVPVDAKFRAYCEENLCGLYGANYSCPPDCGAPQEMHRQILAQDRALIISKTWDVVGFSDKCAVAHARRTHNDAVLRLTRKLRTLVDVGFCAGYNGCPLCEPCLRTKGAPCAHPDERISCMSAYCIDVAKLAERCSLGFDWVDDKLFLFGMIAYREKDAQREE